MFGTRTRPLLVSLVLLCSGCYAEDSYYFDWTAVVPCDIVDNASLIIESRIAMEGDGEPDGPLPGSRFDETVCDPSDVYRGSVLLTIDLADTPQERKAYRVLETDLQLNPTNEFEEPMLLCNDTLELRTRHMSNTVFKDRLTQDFVARLSSC